MSSTTTEIRLPAARGALSEWLLGRLRDPDHDTPPPVPAPGSGLSDDVQLALYLCYELHFSSLPGVDAGLEWDPAIIAFRSSLESAFEERLVELTAALRSPGADIASIDASIDVSSDVAREIERLIAEDDGPSLSTYMEREGTLDDMRRAVIHRSAYQLKEGDAHTLAIARLSGRAKQILVEIQAGEYGADAPDRMMHCDLFAQTMRALGLDDRRHAYLDVQPASALAISNLISLFGLHRRRRGALVGHLAVFEMTSVTPMGRYARALERLGASEDARRFFEVHVLADAEHEVMALEMASALAAQEPALVPDILFGARCVIATERLYAADLLARSTARQRVPRRRVAA